MVDCDLILRRSNIVIVVDVTGETLSAYDIDIANSHHSRSVHIVHQGEQQVLQRRVLVLSLVGVGAGPMQDSSSAEKRAGALFVFWDCCVAVRSSAPCMVAA